MWKEFKKWWDLFTMLTACFKSETKKKTTLKKMRVVTFFLNQPLKDFWTNLSTKTVITGKALSQVPNPKVTLFFI
jgi:hypothetical protein